MCHLVNSIIIHTENVKYTYCCPRSSIPLTFTFFFACAITLTFIFLPQVTLLIICFLYYISIKFATEDLPGFDTITTACRALNKARINLSGSKQNTNLCSIKCIRKFNIYHFNLPQQCSNFNFKAHSSLWCQNLLDWL
jgi:hypothetical protein